MSTLTVEIENEVVEIIKEYVPDAERSILEKKLSEIDVSSMDFISMVFDIEDKYSIDIDVAEVDMEMPLWKFVETNTLAEAG